MISRIWHGSTTPSNADIYEKLLKEEIFTGIQDRKIPGFREIHLLRRDLMNEVEFITIMWFDDLESVRTFAGDEYEKAVVPPKAKQVLTWFDCYSQHYQVRETRIVPVTEFQK